MPDLQSPQGKQEEEPTIQTPKGSSESEEELIVPSVEPRAIADGELEPVDTIVIKDGESYRQMRVYSAKRGAKETEEHNCKECGFKSVDFDEYKDHMKAHNTPVGSQGESKHKKPSMPTFPSMVNVQIPCNSNLSPRVFKERNDAGNCFCSFVQSQISIFF